MTTTLKSFENVYGGCLVVHCNACGNEARKDVAELAGRLGWGHVVWDGRQYRLPLKCSCGSKAYSITIDRDTESEVAREERLKSDTLP